ncbi:hypothetical protein C6P42_004130 [Pichia californica]|nr:hypothetical protein C6P42_004130 [[Candida] californica]
MTSTLKRSLTDIMEDELYFSSELTENTDSHHQQQQQQTSATSQSSQPTTDFFQYLSLPNNSQDSLQKLNESENPSTLGNNNISSQNQNSLDNDDDDDDDDYNDDQHHTRYPHQFEEDDEDDNDDSIDPDNDGDLYTSAFQQRKESVLLDAKPIIKKERSLSARHSTRPKRLRRSSNHIVSNPLSTSSFRKPRGPANTHTSNSPSPTANTSNNTNNESNKNNNTAIADDDEDLNNDANEEHVCNIPNPKTGKPCLKRFSRPYDLVRHQNTIHASKRSFFRCMFCEDDLRRKHDLDSVNKVVVACKYRNSQHSKENSISHITSSHNVKKIKSGSLDNAGYLSNKTFSRCDALTRHLRFRHGLTNNQVIEAMDFAKKNVEFYDN